MNFIFSEYDGYLLMDNSGYMDSRYNMKIEGRSSTSSNGSFVTDEGSALVPYSQSTEEHSDAGLEISNFPTKSVDEVPKRCVVCLEPTKCYHYGNFYIIYFITTHILQMFLHVLDARHSSEGVLSPGKGTNVNLEESAT